MEVAGSDMGWGVVKSSLTLLGCTSLWKGWALANTGTDGWGHGAGSPC